MMILLLPLRGWAGNFMGVQMAFTESAAHSAAAMPPDCSMQMSAQAQDAGEEHSSHSSHSSSNSETGKQSCSACQLCTSMAEPFCNGIEAGAFAVHEAPLMFQVSFVSTALAPITKPPIF